LNRNIIGRTSPCFHGDSIRVVLVLVLVTGGGMVVVATIRRHCFHTHEKQTYIRVKPTTQKEAAK
jgi:hypothetical protein